MVDYIIDESHDVIPVLSMGAFRATPLGLIVIGSPTYEECEAYGLGLQVVVYATPFIIGDWLYYVEEHFPDRYTQMVAFTGLQTETLRNYKWAMGRVPMSLRSDVLT